MRCEAIEHTNTHTENTEDDKCDAHTMFIRIADLGDMPRLHSSILAHSRSYCERVVFVVDGHRE